MARVSQDILITVAIEWKTFDLNVRLKDHSIGIYVVIPSFEFIEGERLLSCLPFENPRVDSQPRSSIECVFGDIDELID